MFVEHEKRRHLGGVTVNGSMLRGMLCCVVCGGWWYGINVACAAWRHDVMMRRQHYSNRREIGVALNGVLTRHGNVCAAA